MRQNRKTSFHKTAYTKDFSKKKLSKLFQCCWILFTRVAHCITYTNKQESQGPKMTNVTCYANVEDVQFLNIYHQQRWQKSDMFFPPATSNCPPKDLFLHRHWICRLNHFAHLSECIFKCFSHLLNTRIFRTIDVNTSACFVPSGPEL